MNLQWVVENATHARYLTKEELERLAAYFEGHDGSLADFLRGEHAPASGRCFEVLLTEREAKLVDRVCDAMGRGS